MSPIDILWVIYRIMSMGALIYFWSLHFSTAACNILKAKENLPRANQSSLDELELVGFAKG